VTRGSIKVRRELEQVECGVSSCGSSKSLKRAGRISGAEGGTKLNSKRCSAENLADARDGLPRWTWEMLFRKGGEIGSYDLGGIEDE